MPRVRLLLAVAALGGSAYLVSAAAVSAQHRHVCGMPSAQTVVADRVARVYRVPSGHDELGRVYVYYGCAVGNSKPQRLVRDASRLTGARRFGCGDLGCTVVRSIHLAGATVGAIIEFHGLDSINGTLTVRDLRSRHALHTVQTYAVVGGGTLIAGDLLISYVLARSGNIAWSTVCYGLDACGPNSQSRSTLGIIHRAIGHSVMTLDEGPTVRPKSLHRRGGTIEWIDGGVQRSAPLP